MALDNDALGAETSDGGLARGPSTSPRVATSTDRDDMTEKSSRLGRDLDAFRRHRSEAPGWAAPELSPSLLALQGSEQPSVMFARLADAVVPEVADGCRVELDDASGEDRRFRSEVGTSDPDGEPARRQVVGYSDLRAVPVLVRGPARGAFPSYVGIVTFSWTSREPTPTDRLLADLLVKHAVAAVDLERLLAMVSRADDHAAETSVSAIASRSINVALGIVIHQHGCTEDEAEELLRQFPSWASRSLHETALLVIRHGGLPDDSAVRALPDPRSRRR